MGANIKSAPNPVQPCNRRAQPSHPGSMGKGRELKNTHTHTHTYPSPTCRVPAHAIHESGLPVCACFGDGFATVCRRRRRAVCATVPAAVDRRDFRVITIVLVVDGRHRGRELSHYDEYRSARERRPEIYREFTVPPSSL